MKWLRLLWGKRLLVFATLAISGCKHSAPVGSHDCAYSPVDGGFLVDCNK